MSLTQAIEIARGYQQYGESFPKETKLRAVKRLEHALGFPFLRRQQHYNVAVVDALEGLRDGIENRAETSSVRAEYASHHEGIAALRRDMVAIQQEVADLHKRHEGVLIQQRTSQAHLDLFLNEVRRALPAAPEQSTLAALPNAWDGLYASFEDLYRGDFQEIQSRLKPYLGDLPSGSPSGEQTGLVLDVGCGRGEWLALLKDNDVPAYGVDLNPEVAARAGTRGLDVRTADALQHLRELPERSLAAVTAFHIAEHLDVETLISLIDLSLRALRPGGRLIIETPNPGNLTVGATTFHLDPTHRLPLPTQLLEFLVQSRGFTEVEVRLLTRDAPPLTVPAQDSELAPVVELLNRYLGVAPDYAVLATRL